MCMDAKQLIKDTFLVLLEERPLSQITIKDIVGTAGINRNSFYYHYADLPTLIEEMVCEEVENIFAGHENIESLEECLNLSIDFALANRKLALHLCNTGNRDIFEHYLFKITDNLLRKYFVRFCEGRNVSDIDTEVLIKYYKCLLFGLVMDWISTGMDSDIRSSINRLLQIFEGVPEEIVKRITID